MAKETSKTVKLKIAYKQGGMEAAARAIYCRGKGPWINPDYVIELARSAAPDFAAEIKGGKYSKLDDRFRALFDAEPEVLQTYRIKLMFDEAFAILALERKADRLKAAEKAKRDEAKARRAA